MVSTETEKTHLVSYVGATDAMNIIITSLSLIVLKLQTKRNIEAIAGIRKAPPSILPHHRQYHHTTTNITIAPPISPHHHKYQRTTTNIATPQKISPHHKKISPHQ